MERRHRPSATSGPANASTHDAALTALVRLLARQAAREALVGVDPSPNHPEDTTNDDQ